MYTVPFVCWGPGTIRDKSSKTGSTFSPCLHGTYPSIVPQPAATVIVQYICRLLNLQSRNCIHLVVSYTNKPYTTPSHGSSSPVIQSLRFECQFLFRYFVKERDTPPLHTVRRTAIVS
jgi:hypothetical protein